MSATISKIMRVEVKNGDAVPNNRLKGKSNTGTYFICSSKDWLEFEEFLPEDKRVKYFIKLDQVEKYKNLFASLFYRFRDLYPDRMKNFEPYCESLYCYTEDPQVIFTLRKNDNRVFLKFDDNCKSGLERQFRDILYANLSYIVFEKVDDHKCYVYPEVNLMGVSKLEYGQE